MNRAVFDTGVVVSALLFRSGPVAELRDLWRSNRLEAIVSRETVTELIRVLAYPKFELTAGEIEAVLGDYLPYTRSLASLEAPRRRLPNLPRCRDAADQVFLELAARARADVLVSGDRDLLALADRVSFALEDPATCLARFRS